MYNLRIECNIFSFLFKFYFYVHFIQRMTNIYISLYFYKWDAILYFCSFFHLSYLCRYVHICKHGDKKALNLNSKSRKYKNIHINLYHFYYKSILPNGSNVLLWIVSSENRLYRIMWMCWATRGSHRSSQYLKSTANYSSQYSNGSLNLRNSSRRRKGLHECDPSYHSTRFRN